MGTRPGDKGGRQETPQVNTSANTTSNGAQRPDHADRGASSTANTNLPSLQPRRHAPRRRRETSRPAAKRLSGWREKEENHTPGLGPPLRPFLLDRHGGGLVSLPRFPHRQENPPENRTTSCSKRLHHHDVGSTQRSSSTRRQAPIHRELPRRRSHAAHSR